MHVHVIEKSGRFGGGGVHSITQPDYLLLNTIGSQITAFGDDDTVARSSDARKTLHGYLTSLGIDSGPNDYPSRAQHGRYLADMFDWAQEQKPPGVSIHRHIAGAVDIEAKEKSVYKIVLDNGKSIDAHEIILLSGHSHNRIPPDTPAWKWKDFAREQQKKNRNISYLHFVYPLPENIEYIAPGESVYVIGMGLTAVDVVKAFTIGRGGRFEQDRYIPSGEEPFLILGSRLGVPYSARGHNQKTGQYKGRFLIPERISGLKKAKDKIDFETDLLPLIIREMEYVYYTTLMGEDFGEKLAATEDETDRQKLIFESVPPEDRFLWNVLVDPFFEIRERTPSGHPWFTSMEEYMSFVMGHMEKDIEEARKGNMTSPLKTAIDSVLRDLRDTLRLGVDKGGLTAQSHRYLYEQFNRINNRIAVGPPVSSTRELLLLAEAGVVSFSGPSPRLIPDPGTGAFIVESDYVKGSKRHVQHVLNARIHSVNNRNDSSLLMENLFRRKMIRQFANIDETDVFEPGGLDVTDDFQIIGEDGRGCPNICALGIPIEGKYWFNAADARPDVNSNAIGQLSRWAESAVARLKEREVAENTV